MRNVLFLALALVTGCALKEAEERPGFGEFYQSYCAEVTDKNFSRGNMSAAYICDQLAQETYSADNVVRVPCVFGGLPSNCVVLEDQIRIRIFPDRTNVYVFPDEYELVESHLVMLAEVPEEFERFRPDKGAELIEIESGIDPDPA